MSDAVSSSSDSDKADRLRRAADDRARVDDAKKSDDANKSDDAKKSGDAKSETWSKETKAAASVDARKVAKGQEKAKAPQAEAPGDKPKPDAPKDPVDEAADRINKELRENPKAGADDLDKTMKDLSPEDRKRLMEKTAKAAADALKRAAADHKDVDAIVGSLAHAAEQAGKEATKTLANAIAETTPQGAAQHALAKAFERAIAGGKGAGLGVAVVDALHAAQHDSAAGVIAKGVANGLKTVKDNVAATQAKVKEAEAEWNRFEKTYGKHLTPEQRQAARKKFVEDHKEIYDKADEAATRAYDTLSGARSGADSKDKAVKNASEGLLDARKDIFSTDAGAAKLADDLATHKKGELPDYLTPRADHPGEDAKLKDAMRTGVVHDLITKALDKEHKPGEVDKAIDAAREHADELGMPALKDSKVAQGLHDIANAKSVDDAKAALAKMGDVLGKDDEAVKNLAGSLALGVGLGLPGSDASFKGLLDVAEKLAPGSLITLADHLGHSHQAQQALANLVKNGVHSLEKVVGRLNAVYETLHSLGEAKGGEYAKAALGLASAAVEIMHMVAPRILPGSVAGPLSIGLGIAQLAYGAYASQKEREEQDAKLLHAAGFTEHQADALAKEPRVFEAVEHIAKAGNVSSEEVMKRLRSLSPEKLDAFINELRLAKAQRDPNLAARLWRRLASSAS